jgi:hypothetical protein
MNVEEIQLSNKKWARRLAVVKKMENWIAENIKDRGLYDTYDRSSAVKISKAKEYFYGYLFWGRMRFPSHDPLFFCDDRNERDESLANQLNDGKYTEFINEFMSRTADKIFTGVESDPVVAYTDVCQYAVGRSLSVLETLKASIQDKKIQKDVCIGLILRYRCVGGFKSNLHGSVPEEWKDALVDFTECFASPLNHKFERYYSVFDEDSVFGGMGDFFLAIGSTLPSGKYEINPPFHVALLDRVADIVAESFRSGANLQVVMVVPDWQDSHFVPVLDSVCRALGSFACVLLTTYRYTHANGRPLSTKTRFYILTSRNTAASETKELFETCVQLTSPSTTVCATGSRLLNYDSYNDQSSETRTRSPRMRKRSRSRSRSRSASRSFIHRSVLTPPCE